MSGARPDRHSPPDQSRAVLDAAPFAVVITALADGTIRYVNAAAERMFGVTAEAARGQRAADFWVDPAERDALVERLRRGEAVRGAEVRARRPDGTTLWAQASISLLEFEGQPASCSAFADITASKLAAQALLESERKHRLLVESSHDLIYTLSTAGVFTFASPSFEVQLGWPAAEVVGRHFAVLTHPDDVPRCQRFLERLLGSAERMGDFEHRALHRDGTWRWFLTNAVPLQDAEGRPVGMEGVASSLDERKRLEERARRAERASSLGTMAAGVAHEINNPLTYAMAGLRYAEERLEALPASFRAAWPASEDGGLADLEEALAEASQGARRVRDLVADLGALAAGQHTTDARCDLGGALARAARVAHHAFGPGAALALDLPRLPAVAGSEAELVQLFSALLINAGQATGGLASAVRLTAEARDGQVVVRVADRGAGMAPEVLACVFDPFATTRAVGAGRGLGLPVALAIARGLGGDVDVRSTEGQGTTVTVTLRAAG